MCAFSLLASHDGLQPTQYQGGLTSPPVGRRRRANSPPSLAQHRFQKIYLQPPSFSVRDAHFGTHTAAATPDRARHPPARRPAPPPATPAADPATTRPCPRPARPAATRPPPPVPAPAALRPPAA